MIKNRYAVWCKGFSPVGCFNTDIPESESIKEIVNKQREIYDNAIAVCDDTGVVIIPKDQIIYIEIMINISISYKNIIETKTAEYLLNYQHTYGVINGIDNNEVINE